MSADEAPGFPLVPRSPFLVPRLSRPDAVELAAHFVGGEVEEAVAEDGGLAGGRRVHLEAALDVAFEGRDLRLAAVHVFEPLREALPEPQPHLGRRRLRLARRRRQPEDEHDDKE